MSRQCYVDKNFNAEHSSIIVQADSILSTYYDQGYVLTLRQLYYQFVARDLIENTQRSYKRLGGIINDARLAGLLDWDHMEDRTRGLMGSTLYTSPGAAIDEIRRRYRIDKWKGQSYRPEVWVEKDALVDVIRQACKPYQVNYFSCRGYTSQSEMRVAGERFRYYMDNGQTPVLIHLGDHDPSGIDMSRDIRERIEMFSDWGHFEFRRIALNMDQIDHYEPPPNPAKLTDSRAGGYVAEHGYDSWELDALEPDVLKELIGNTIVEFLDAELWDEAAAKEKEDKRKLRDAARSLRRKEDDDD